MKQFFIRKILPPVLIQLSVIAALMYYEVKNFVPYASTDEVGVDFLPIFVSKCNINMGMAGGSISTVSFSNT